MDMVIMVFGATKFYIVVCQIKENIIMVIKEGLLTSKTLSS